MEIISIGKVIIGLGHPTLLVAEVAQNHDGSLGMAHSYIDAAADAGVDAIKFQTHIAAAESTRREPWRVKFSEQDDSRYDYWKRMEFTEVKWRGLQQHADSRGLLFLSSPFSIEAADLLSRVGVPAWKISSGEVGNDQMMEKVAATGLPVLLSSGMSDWKELDHAVSLCKCHQAPFAILQCTTAYPCPTESVGLNLLSEIRLRYGCPVGLSDHTGEIFAGLAAVALGANILEFHFTLSRRMFGPDVPSSLTFDDTVQLVRGVRAIEAMMASPVDKDKQALQSADMARIFGKSIVARTALTAGTVLTLEHVTMKKPGTGLPQSALPDVLGRRLRRQLAPDDELTWEDLE